MSASWKASVPISARPTCPVIATTGIESICASASGVTRLVAPGPDVAMQHADLAGGVRVAAGRVAGALLVANQHVAQLLRVEQRVVDRQHGTAGNPEDDLDVEFFQRPDHRLCTGELLRRNMFRPNRRRLWRRASPRSDAPLATSCDAGLRSRSPAARSALVGALTVSSSSSCSLVRGWMSFWSAWATKNPRQLSCCTRVARWCWAMPSRGQAPTRRPSTTSIPEADHQHARR